MQFDAGIEQHGVGVGEGGVVAVEHHRAGGLGPVHGVHITQATPTVFHVGLQQKGGITRPGMPVANRRAQLGQPLGRLLSPHRQRPLSQLVGECVIAGNVANGQHRRGRVQIRGGKVHGLTHRPHGVAQLEALVPHRVPQRLGNLGDLSGVGASRRDQHHVDVALR